MRANGRHTHAPQLRRQPRQGVGGRSPARAPPRGGPACARPPCPRLPRPRQAARGGRAPRRRRRPPPPVMPGRCMEGESGPCAAVCKVTRQYARPLRPHAAGMRRGLGVTPARRPRPPRRPPGARAPRSPRPRRPPPWRMPAPPRRRLPPLRRPPARAACAPCGAGRERRGAWRRCALAPRPSCAK